MDKTPENEGENPDLLDELADEFVGRKQAGEAPTVSEYCQRYPALDEEIRELFPMLSLLENAKPRADESGAGVAPPPSIAGYRVLHEIGRGGMGVVYEAWHAALDRHVALKVLSARLSRDQRARARFEREARAVAGMHHSNIVPLFEVGEDDEHAYLTMQLIQGASLQTLIYRLQSAVENTQERPSRRRTSTERTKVAALDDTVRLPLDSPRPSVPDGVPSSPDDFGEIALICAQVADALEYAHARDVIHRDVKPSNILIDEQGAVWLTDFGLAKAGDDELTRTSEFVGTLHYMAPERFMGQSDARGDVYSLGLTLYELLLLRPAFRGADHAEVMHKIQNVLPARPRSLNPRIPRDLETIALKAIEKSPERRYATAGEMAEDLRRFVDDQPIRARRASIAEQAYRWSRRNRGLAAATALIAAMTVAIAVGSSVASLKFRAQRDRAIIAESVARDQRDRAMAAEKVARGERDRAMLAEQLAESRLAERELQRQRAVDAERVANQVIEFLKTDVLSKASPYETRDPNVSLRAILDKAAETVDSRFRDQPDSEAAIRLTIGQAYESLGLHQRAEPHLRRAWELSKTFAGEEAAYSLTIAGDLGEIYRHLGRYRESEQLLTKTLETQRRVLGENDFDTFATANSLAGLYQELGRLEEAAELMHETWKGRRDNFGREHLNTLSSQTNLGNIYAHMGRHAEAEKLLLESSKIKLRVFGLRHPLTLIARNNLASLYLRTKRFDEAETLLNELNQVMPSVMGADHPDTITIKNNLAALYFSKREFQRSTDLMVEVLEARRRILGDAHPATLSAKSNLANVCQHVGQFDKAESLFLEVLAAQREMLSPDHPVVVENLTNLGILYLNRQSYDEARNTFTEAIEANERTFGKGHPGARRARKGRDDSLRKLDEQRKDREDDSDE